MLGGFFCRHPQEFPRGFSSKSKQAKLLAFLFTQPTAKGDICGLLAQRGQMPTNLPSPGTLVTPGAVRQAHGTAPGAALPVHQHFASPMAMPWLYYQEWSFRGAFSASPFCLQRKKYFHCVKQAAANHGYCFVYIFMSLSIYMSALPRSVC